MPSVLHGFGCLPESAPSQFDQSTIAPVEPIPCSTHRTRPAVSPPPSTTNRTTTRSDHPPSSTNRTTPQSNRPKNPSSGTSTRSAPSKPPSSRASARFTSPLRAPHKKRSPPPSFPATRPHPARFVATDGNPRQHIKQGDEVME